MHYLTRSAASVAVLIALTACSSETNLPEVEAKPPAAQSSVGTETPLAQAEKKVTLSPVPTWAKTRTIPNYPEARKDQTRNGIEYLLTDDQYRHESGGFEYVSRMAFRVSDRSYSV